MAVLPAAAACRRGPRHRDRPSRCRCLRRSTPRTTVAPPTGRSSLTVDVFGQFGYQDSTKEYMAQAPRTSGRAPRHRHQPRRVLAEADPGVGRRPGCRRRGRHRGRPDASSTRPTRRTSSTCSTTARAELKDNFLPWKWDAGLTADGKQLDRPRHRRRRHGHVLPQGPLREGRPADRPRRGLQALADLEDFIATGKKFAAKNTGASFLDGAPTRSTRSCCRTAGNSTGYTLLRHRATSWWSTATRPCKTGVRQSRGHHRRRASPASTRSGRTRLGHRLQAGEVRHDRLPRLDDRRHRGQRRRRRPGQVGHRPDPRQRRQLGRIAPRRSRRRASTRPRRSSWPSS